MTNDDHSEHDGDEGPQFGISGKVSVCDVQLSAKYELWSLVGYQPMDFCRQMAHSKDNKRRCLTI